MISYHYFFIDYFVFSAPQVEFNYYLLEFIRICFISISGFSLALCYSKKDNLKYFSNRILKLLFACFLVSFISYLFFPEYFIYFGILHLITFCNVFVFLYKFHKRFLAPLLIIGLISFPNIIHLSLIERSTLDFFPLLPYSLYFLFGYAGYLNLGQFLPLKKPNQISKLVRHSLLIYLVHPVIIFIFLQVYYSLIENLQQLS